MKYSLIISIILGFLVPAFCQVSSDNINYILQVQSVNYYDSGNEGGNDPEPAWKFSTGTTSSANNLLINECITAPDQTTHTVNRLIASQLNVTASRRVYWKAEGWENDDTNSSRYCTYDTGDDQYHTGAGSILARFGDPGIYNSGSNFGMGSSEWRPRVLWGYNNGQWWENSGLYFGVLNQGDDKSHLNTTYGTEYGVIVYGRKNTFTPGAANVFGAPAQNTNDAYYRFDIADTPKKVSIATSVATFSHYIHLMHKEDGVFTHVASSNGLNPNIVENLPPGIYYIIFEGAGTSNGKFAVHIAVSDPPLDSGSIAVETPNICEGVDLPSIASTNDSKAEVWAPSTETQVEPDRYFWEKRILGVTDWNNTGISEEREATLDPVGQMVENQDVAFRRRAILGSFTTDWVYDTVFFQPSSISAGTIGYDFEDYVREDYVLQDNIAPTMLAVGNPTPLKYRWEKKIPNATSFVTIDNEGNPYDSLLLIPEVLGGLGEGFTNIRRVAINGCGAEAISNEIIIKGRPADGSIQGKITAPPIGFGPGIKDVEVCATPLDPIYGVETVCDTTDLNGSYFLPELYYGENGLTKYLVEPKYLDHQIRTGESSEDSTRTIELSSTVHNIQTNTNFVDLSTFTVSGNIYQKFQEAGQVDVNYGKSKVIIYLENELTGLEEIADTTDANGDYAIVIPNGGNWKITPRLIETAEDNPHTHTFSPASRSFLITDNLTGIDFENTSTMNISGFVGASCNNYLGTTLLRFYQDPKDGNFNRTFRTNLGSGTFDYTLPAREYLIEVVDNAIEDKVSNNFNYAKVEDQFSVFQFSASLSHQDTAFTLNYKAPPTITVEGLPELPLCDQGSFDYPILEKRKFYQDFSLQVWDGLASNNCPLDTGYMDVVDGIGGRGNGTVSISNGTPKFYLIAGDPNIVEASNYLLTNNFVVGDFINAETASYNLTALVTGGKPQQETFVTVSPKIPLLVLHDPPGDRSFSSYAQGSSIETRTSTYVKDANSNKGWASVSSGTKFDLTVDAGPVEFTTSTKVIAEVQGGRTVERVYDTTDVAIQRISNLETIKTSDDPSLIGDQGDVFFGAAYNFTYALTDEIGFNYETCEVEPETGFYMDPDSIATTFLLTTRAIENEIKELTRLRDIQSPDSIMYFQNQINVWQQTINNNRLMKQRLASTNDTLSTYTFSGLASRTESESITIDTTKTIEFMLDINKEVAITAGIEIAGVGLKGGYMGNFSMVTGGDSTVTQSVSTTVDFTLEDDDPDDKLSVKIYKDSESATPVFVSFNSRTSCPYEDTTALGTDQFIFSHAFGSEPIKTGIDPEVGASYQVLISNYGLFDRTYNMSVDPAYNQDAALVSIGGKSPGAYHVVPVLAGTSVTVTITVDKKSSVDVFSYRNLKINVDPICNVGGNDDISVDDTRQSLFLSATFLGDCSQMDITSPTDYTVVNAENQHELPIRLQNYDIEMLDRAVLQYRAVGSGDWTSSALVDLNAEELEVGSSGTLLIWDVGEVVEEGLHEIRFKIICTTPGTMITNVNYSNSVIIDIDRVAPQLYGIPLPIDDNYDVANDDELGATFNESICDRGSTLATAILVDLIRGDTIITSVSCADNSIRIVEQGAPLSLREPSIYRAILSGVTDMAGNIGQDVKWIFSVGDFTPTELGCISDLFVTNNNENQDAINVANYNAISIKSSGMISDFGETTFSAQEEITLEPGFEVSKGGILEADISTCQDN